MSVQSVQSIVPPPPMSDIDTLETCIVGLRKNIEHIQLHIKNLKNEEINKLALSSLLRRNNEEMDMLINRAHKTEKDSYFQIARFDKERNQKSDSPGVHNAVPTDIVQSINQIASNISSVVNPNVGIGGCDPYSSLCTQSTDSIYPYSSCSFQNSTRSDVSTPNNANANMPGRKVHNTPDNGNLFASLMNNQMYIRGFHESEGKLDITNSLPSMHRL